MKSIIKSVMIGLVLLALVGSSGLSQAAEPAQPNSVWQTLENLDPAARANAHLNFELPPDCPQSIRQVVNSIENLWNNGQPEVALNRFKQLETENNQLNLAVGIQWKQPHVIEGANWGTDVKVSSQSKIEEICLDFDRETENLFVALKWHNSWSVNMSTNGGQTWYETYRWTSASYHINDIDAVVILGDFYVGYISGSAQHTGKISRFKTSTGGIDYGFGSRVVFDDGIEVKELAITSSEDIHRDSIYYIALLANYKLRYLYAYKGTDFKDWEDNGCFVNDADRGLDVCYNKYPGAHLFVSYISTDRRVEVARKKSSGWDIFKFSGQPKCSHSDQVTSISAYDDHVVVAFEFTYSSGPGIRTYETADGGDNWCYKDTGVPAGYEHSLRTPDVTGRKGDGFALLFCWTKGQADYVNCLHRSYGSNNWTDLGTANDYYHNNPVIENDVEIEWLPPRAGRKSFGAVWIYQFDNHTAYFDRIDAEEEACPEWIKLTYPNGGETWFVGNKYKITWQTDKKVGKVRIDISTTNGRTWWDVTQGKYTDNDGSYEYKVVPQNISNQCFFRVVAVCNPNVQDCSDDVFTIMECAPDITVDPNPWNYGSVEVGQSAQKSFEIKNYGCSDLHVTAMQFSDCNPAEFCIQSGGNPPFTIPAGQKRHLVIVFKPTSGGEKCASLDIYSNDPDENPYKLKLKGTAWPIGPSWKAPLTVSGSNNVSFQLYFGGDPNATDAFDTGLDVAAPPGITYYAYFSISGVINTLSTDIRKWVAPYQESIEWKLIIEKATNITSTLTWDADQLPTEGSFTLEGDGLNVNMRTKETAQVTGNAILKIKYDWSKTATHTYTFPTPGWYLISLPVEPDDNNLSTLFPTASQAYAYDSANNAYIEVTELDPIIGYWLLMPAAATVDVTGKILNSYTRNYIAGWHIIGSVYGDADFSDPQDIPDGSVITVYGWDAIAKQYNLVYPATASVLKAGAGYWIALLQNCTLKIGGPLLAKTDGKATTDFNKFYQQFGAQPPAPPFIEEQPLADLIPQQSELTSNFPNPFNASTTIHYSLSKGGQTRIQVFNSIGQRIRTLVDVEKPAGIHHIGWDGRDDFGEMVTSGIYFYSIVAPGITQTRKMLYLK